MHHRIRAALAVSAWLISAASPAADIDIGVSIAVSQPGVYGRIDIGRFPSPLLVSAQPAYVQRAPHRVEPVYLWVPPGHQKNWRKHCQRYQACGVPVYFVKDEWYERHVRHSDRHSDRRDDRDHPGKGRGHGKDKHRD